MKKITPDTSAADLQARVTSSDHSDTPPWQSSSQRAYLERLARSVIRDARGCSVAQSEIEVVLTSNKVACRPKAGGGYEICISATADPQYVTDLPKECWELLRQEVELFHELGHVLYTSWGQFETRLEDVESGWEHAFDRVNNAAEDGAIEWLIKREYNIADDLDVYHANRVAIADRQRAAKAADRAAPPVVDRLQGGANAGIALATKLADKDPQFTPRLPATTRLKRGVAAGIAAATELADADSQFDSRMPAATRLRRGADAGTALATKLADEDSRFAPPTPASSEGLARKQPIRVYSVLEGVTCGLLDMGRFDSGRFATLIDPEDPRRQVRNQRVDLLRELKPRMESLMQAMLTEPDGAARVDLTYEFWEELKPKLEEVSQANATVDVDPTGRPNDADTHVVSGALPADALDEAEVDIQIQDSGEITTETAEPGPEDADDPGNGPRDDAPVRDDTTSRASPADSHSDNSGEKQADGTAAYDETSESDDISPTDTGETQDGAVLEPALEPSEEGTPEIDVDAASLKDKYDAASTESDPVDDPLADELDDITDALADDDTAIDELGVVDPEAQAGDRDRWERATRIGQTLAADLRSRLQANRASEPQVGHRSGRIDSQRVYGAETGAGRIFQRVDESEEKDYSCQIVLDRSRSMLGKRIEAAEEAVGQLLYALEAVGIDVSVLSVFNDRPWLEVPFGGAPSEYHPAIMTRRSWGSTPLSLLLELARERVHTGDGEHPLVIVITDGLPDDEGAYQEALAACNFDVYGVYIDEDAGADERRAHAQNFDRLVYSSPSDVAQRLRALVNKIVY